jgi:hypothetical protein
MDYMRAQLERAGPATPRAIGVDEISIRKGHVYRIVVSDLELGRAIWFGGEGRKEEDMAKLNIPISDWVIPIRQGNGRSRESGCPGLSFASESQDPTRAIRKPHRREDQDTHKTEYPYIRLGNSITSGEWRIARKWVSRSFPEPANFPERRFGAEVAVLCDSRGIKELEDDPSLEACVAELPDDVWRRARAIGGIVKNSVTQFV